jgi:hypothetical protein
MQVKLAFLVCFILSAYMENTQKVFKRINRIRQIRVGCGTQNCLRIRGMDLQYAYMEKTPRDTKLSISWLIMV